MKFTRVLGVVGVAALLAAACGGAAAPTATPTKAPAPQPTAGAAAAAPGATPTRALAATPTPTATRPAAEAGPAEPRGKITVAVSSFLDERLDPHKMVGNQMQLLYDEFYTLLVFQDAESRPIPQLAKSWSVKPDGRGWTFELRTDARFHDGTPITAEDVVYVATRRARVNPQAKVADPQSLESVVATGPTTVQFNLKVPPDAYKGTLGFGMPQWYVLSKKYIESLPNDDAFGEKPLGSGPFRLVRRAIGEFIELEAVPNHWYKTPYVKNVTLRLIPDQTTRVAMLRAGEAEIVNGVAGLDAVGIKNTPGLGVKLGEGTGFGWLTLREFNVKDSPYSDIRVRRALAHAIDYKAIEERVFFGQFKFIGSIGSSGAFGWEPRPLPYPYDPVKAKQLLAEAGFPDGKGLEPTIYHGVSGAVPLQPEWAQAIAAGWNNIGVKAKVIRLEAGAFYGCAQRQPACKDIHPIHAMTSIRSYDLGGTLGLYRTDPTAPSGYSSYYQAHDKVTDDLFYRQRVEFDQAKREEMIKQAGRHIMEQAWVLGNYEVAAVWGVNTNRVAAWDQPKNYPYETNLWTLKLK